MDSAGCDTVALLPEGVNTTRLDVTIGPSAADRPQTLIVASGPLASSNITGVFFPGAPCACCSMGQLACLQHELAAA